MKRETKELKPWQGFATFGVVILYLLFVAYPIQRAIGLWGVFITEIGFLIIAFAANFIFGGDVKTTFSFRKFTVRQFFGSMFIWLGAMCTGLAVSMVMLWIFPEMANLSQNLSSAFTSENMFVSILIVAISPAICEEMVHRGFIMGSFAGIKNKALVVLMTGVIFGIFHLDAYRFLQTAILGAALAYILVETKSIFLTMAFHFINNFYSLMTAFAAKKLGTLTSDAVATVQTQLNGAMVLANCLIYGAIALGFLYGGYMLITKREKKPHGIRNMVIVIMVAMAMIVSGLVVNFINVMNNLSVGEIAAQSSIELDADAEIKEQFELTEDGSYRIFADMNIDKDGAVGAMILSDKNGDILFNCTGSGLSIESSPIDLKSGEYTVNIYSISNHEEWAEYTELTGVTDEMFYDFLDPEYYKVTGNYKIVKQ